MNTLADRNLPDLAAAPEPEDETLDLVRYWRAINRNKWRILALVVAVGILAALIAQSLPHVYRGTVTMLLEVNKPKIVSIEEIYNVGLNREHYQTQLEILKSRDLAAKLVRSMKLAEHPVFQAPSQSVPFWQAWLPAGFIDTVQTPSADAVEQRMIRAVEGGLGVQLVRNSQLVRISFDSTDPQLAAQIPNALADIYVDTDMQARMQMTQRAMTFINTQAGELRKKLLESESALQAYRDRERIIDAKGVSQSGGARQIDDLTRQLGDARARRSDTESAYDQVTAVLKDGASSSALESLPAIQKHPLVLRFREAETDAERRLQEAAKRYGAEHPRMIAADSELRFARENLHRQIGVASQTMKRELEVARSNERALERALAVAKADIAGLNRKEFQLASLERDVQNNRQLYDMFTQRLKETNISEGMQTAIARVIDPAVVPQVPVGPNKRGIVGLSLLGALLVGVALALLIERLDNTVKTSREVEQRLGVPSLGVVQYTRVKRGEQLERKFLDDPQTAVSEAIRSIRSAVLLSALDSPKKIVLITSSVPDEGKTTIAANLALALGQVKKTLLVDADMRRPKIGRILGGKSTDPLGLSELCINEATSDQVLYNIKDTQVWVLPSGKVPPNPQELLASQRLEEIMAVLTDGFDIVVIDSPPVQLVSDALVLSRLATEVIYVVKADETPYPLARQGLRKLIRLGAPVIGVVLNQLDVLKADRYYGEYSGYGKRYYNKKYGYGYTPKQQ